MTRRPNRSRGQQSQQPYDNALKALMEDHAAEIIPEFVPEAVVVIEQSNEIKRENIRADLVYFVDYKNQMHVLNMELQTNRDSDMAARMLQYHVELHLAYRLPVISVVLYLFETGVVESPYQDMSGDEVLLRLHYRVIRLWTLDAQEYVGRHAIRMYPFLPGMNGVNAPLLIQAIEEMKQHYNRSQLARHLTRFGTILHRSGTVTEEDKQIVEEHMQVYDSLLDQDPYIQRWVERKAEQEVQQKLQQKVVEGEVRVLQKVVLDAVEARYPSLLELAREKILPARQTDILRVIVRQIYLAPDENIARFVLETASDQEA